MIIYSFFDGEEMRHFATKVEAVTEAENLIKYFRDNGSDDGDCFCQISVEKCDLGRVTKRQMLHALSGKGFCGEVVWPLPAPSKEG